ncbi:MULTISPECIES: response regulator transcription factor [unclassified Nitrobacter]|uniref:response regulator transcription factor n=1 Tax=unclassified Nitrobacter TaxID=2620411 RepID=UPI000321FE86|nr:MULTISPECIES: response regulator [unclassified Nitrobacter]MCB1393375.1 response regulator [Nitrobacter sp.]MCV0385862.1 response regulator [Nitrobacter sp.]
MTGSTIIKHRVCILDDDPAVLRSMRFLLEIHGFTVRTFSAARTLLASIGPDDVDCLVIDYKLPQMNGLDVAAQLRQQNVAVPIILITGYPPQHMAEKAAVVGIDYILFKPHLEDSLVMRIREAIFRQRQNH